MTKSEVVKAIQIVMSDVFNECYRVTLSIPQKDRIRVSQISEEAEQLMEELMCEVNEVKQKNGYSIRNPKILAIREKLNMKSMYYLNQLHDLAYH